VQRLCRKLAPYTRPTALDAEDLEQEAYLAVLKAMRSYQPGRGRSVRAFVASVLRNRYVGFGRRRHTEGLSDPDLMVTRRQIEGIQRLELQADVQDVTAGLLAEDPRRELKLRLFGLYHFEGWKLEELAAKFGMSVSTVHKCLSQVREAFGKAWELPNSSEETLLE
jgi:RNA polymerase sigma factor (sigma-70 family)